MKRKVNRIIDVYGPIQELDLTEFAWVLYSFEYENVILIDGYLLSYNTATSILEDKKDSKDVEVLVTLFDITYVKVKENDLKKRYIEYNIKKHAARIINNIPENVSKRDECNYFGIIPLEMVHSRFVLDAIKKRRRKI